MQIKIGYLRPGQFTFPGRFIRYGIIWLLGFFLSSSLAVAQDLRITSIDSSRYPEIRVSVLYTGKTKFDPKELQISQSGQPIAYEIKESSPGSANVAGRSLFFLIEASGNTYGKALKDMREGLSSSIDNLDVQDLVNVAWFGSTEADSVNGGFTLLHERFDSRHDNLKNDLIGKISAKQDTAHRVDLYKNILAALDYVASQPDLPKNRLFVVLSTGKNNSKSTISSSECVNRAKELGIPVYAVTYLPSDTAYAAGMMMNRVCIRTNGKNVHARSQIDIINALADFFSIPSPAYMSESAYDLVFQVQPENGINHSGIELNFRGAREIFTVSDGSSTSLIPEDYKLYLWISIGILGLVVVIMILVNVISGRGKTQSNAEPVELPSAPIQEPRPLFVKGAVQAPVKPAPSAVEPPVEPKPGQPVVLVSMDGRTATYPLSKAETTIGRHENNDICLAEQTVTGKHAIIHLKGKEISITDLGSTNGTFVNGERIRNKQIVHGDKIRLGNVELTLKT